LPQDQLARKAPQKTHAEGTFMLKRWLEEHCKFFGVLLLGLAALNGWVAYAIFSDHPIMASANAAMAVVIALGVALSWGTGEPK
jgi:hypothetical protein